MSAQENDRDLSLVPDAELNDRFPEDRWEKERRRLAAWQERDPEGYARTMAERKARDLDRKCKSEDHDNAHNRARDCERRAVESLNHGDTGAAIALALLAVSARLDECASELGEIR